MIGPLQMHSIEFSKDKPGRGIVRIHEGETRKTTDPDDCWVERNPQETRRMAAIGTFRKSRGRLVKSMGMTRTRTCSLPQRLGSYLAVTPARIPTGDAYEISPISTHQYGPWPRAAVIRRTSIFICHELVKSHPEQPEWTEVGTSLLPGEEP
jgi:hypothetical protein